MKIGNRDFSIFIKAIFCRHHYIALFNMFFVYPKFFNSFFRYFLGKGGYPFNVIIRTPMGKISPNVYSYYDMLTVNEIFCRKDYKANNNIKVVVDLGSNIGISALYFLTRNNYSKCYLFEPVPDNINKLKDNLKLYENRCIIEEVAVFNEGGYKRFGTEENGRCGGLLRDSDSFIEVKVIHVNNILADVFKKEENIDILKIDIEGSEVLVLEAINKKLLEKIKVVYFEIDHTVSVGKDFSFYPDLFISKKYGNTIKLTNKHL
jgi:FkbM family methyltransferase